MPVAPRTYILLVIDVLSAVLAWFLFYGFRKIYIEKSELIFSEAFYEGIIIVPLIWISIYALQGTYLEVKRLYRIRMLTFTFSATLIGSLILFFIALLDDEISGYEMYYKLFVALFIIHFFITFIPRFIFVSVQVYRIQHRKDGFNTLLLGGSEKALSIYREIANSHKSPGNTFVGFVNLNGIDTILSEELPYLGHVDVLEKVVAENNVEEAIIALDTTEHKRLNALVARLFAQGIRVKVIPDMFDILSGSVQMNNIFGVLLAELQAHRMPVWQKSVKRVVDVVVSLVALILLLPLFLVLAVLVKTSSEGAVFFWQERIGKNGKVFKIVKFRTMYTNAEEHGPQLSSSEDPRITPIGRVLRKLRLDEFPQFYNVLKGEMSLVGPRPERQFYIDQIAQIEPQFLHLTNVRPGITSWGQVKFGYAENVEQMVQRMKYDLLYLKNMSLALDFKIMLYTVMVIVKAKGK